MKDSKLQFDRSCHVLYSGACKGDTGENRPALPGNGQGRPFGNGCSCKYLEFLSDWRTDLGGSKTSTTARAAPTTALPLCSCYAVCRDVVSFREIEEIEENLILPAFRKLSRFVDCNKPFFKKLMYLAFQNAEKQCGRQVA